MYVHVLLPLKLRWIPTYSTDLPLLRGEAVKVIFSGRKYTGIVWEEDAPAPEGVKRVLKVLDRDEAVPALDAKEMERAERFRSRGAPADKARRHRRAALGPALRESPAQT